MSREKSLRSSGRNEKKDLIKLANAFYENLQIGLMEFGGIGLDDKRPFGNSDVPEDILEIIGEKRNSTDEYSDSQIEYATYLYKIKLIPFLQKNWLGHGKKAETRVKWIKEEEQKKAYLAMGFMDSLEGMKSRPVVEFINLIDQLFRTWKGIKEGDF